MKRASTMVALATAVFAIGAFASRREAYAGTASCRGKDIQCGTTCERFCPNEQDPNECYVICPLQAKAEE